MKLYKWAVVVLVILALAQFMYFGTEDCDVCKLGDMKTREFIQVYEKDCLQLVSDINGTSLNWTMVEPLQLKQPLEYKNETKDN